MPCGERDGAIKGKINPCKSWSALRNVEYRLIGQHRSRKPCSAQQSHLIRRIFLAHIEIAAPQETDRSDDGLVRGCGDRRSYHLGASSPRRPATHLCRATHRTCSCGGAQTVGTGVGDIATIDAPALIRTLRTTPLVFTDVVLTRGGSESRPANADLRRGDLVRPAR